MLRTKYCMIWLTTLGLCLTLFGPVSSASVPEQKPQSLPVMPLFVGIYKLYAMVAQTAEQRQTGLMYRQTMAPNEGMLFVFESPARQCFWMKNTPLPLSAAFVADDGQIVNMVDMEPYSLKSHCSTKPVRFVLEMHQGWFKKRGLKAGDQISGLRF